MNRLPPVRGEWIDRSRAHAFSFDGKNFTGFEGDTVSSALWAAGIRMLGRSFKYHRPRGILSLANHDINGMMQDGPRLNIRADVTLLEPDMTLAPVNTFGGLDRDRGRILDRLSPFLPVGFYYKAFHTKALFPLWEHMFRKLTGLGRVDFQTPRLRTPKQYGFCDVLVVGSGPSGLNAALAAAGAGAEVVLVDENARIGGSGAYQRGADARAYEDVERLIADVMVHPRIRIHTGTLAAGYYGDHWIPLVDKEKLTKMRARSVVVATGAYEQPAVFRRNDLPGVMLASAAQRLIYRYAVQPARRAVVLAANADGYRAALDLTAQGTDVAALVDLRPPSSAQGILESAVSARGIPIHMGWCVLEALPDPGGQLAGARICPLDARSRPQTELARDVPCDAIMMSVGWAPAANLLYQAGARMGYDRELEQFVPACLPDGIFACGRVNGVHSLPSRLLDGRRAGLTAAAHCGFAGEPPAPVPREPECPTHSWPIVEHPLGKNFVDFDEDLQFKDFVNAIQEGFDNIELLKRYTTVGMGPSQGKHSNMNALRILARLTGKAPEEVGTTTARPFVHPVPLSHLAGRGFTPERVTPFHSRHVAAGAHFMPAGLWQRPEYYTVAGLDKQACVTLEVAAVRNAVGLIDVGTLGKIEIQGPQAAEFLERVYTGRYASLRVGMTRYAILCDEAGVVVDDGVVARLGPEHFYFTTTTSGAASVYRELLRLNAQWRLECGIVNLTGAMAAVNLTGPRARETLAPLVDTDLSSAAFPYLGVRKAQVAGIPARIMRVGFVGEWGYEIHVPADQGPALWDALMAAGASKGIRPFGVEAQRLLRLEKGHIIIGQDTDGLTSPFDAGLGWAVKMDKPFFIGQRSLSILAKKAPKQILAGFMLEEGFHGPPPEEGHLVIHWGEIAGRVTSIAWSAALGRHVGLAFLRPELAAEGCRFSIRRSDRTEISALVCPTPFYDPANSRQQEAS